jgi:hypothetical protein
MDFKVLGLFDAYDLHARMFPVMIIITPIFLVICPWLFGIDTVILVSAIALCLLVLGGVIGTKEVAVRGRRYEKKLFASGYPSSLMLTEQTWLSPKSLESKRRYLLEMKPELATSLQPQSHEGWENMDWSSAQLTASRSDPAVQDANRQYGFWRNLAATNYWLAASVALCIASNGVRLWKGFDGMEQAQSYQYSCGAFMLVALTLAIVGFYATETRVQELGQNYAQRLFDSLQPPKVSRVEVIHTFSNRDGD